MAELIKIYNDPRAEDPGVSDTVSRILDALGDIFPGKGLVIQFNGVSQFYVEIMGVDQVPISKQECTEVLKHRIDEILGGKDCVELDLKQYNAFCVFFTGLYNRVNYDPNVDPTEDPFAILRPQWVNDSHINGLMKQLQLQYKFFDLCGSGDGTITGCEISRVYDDPPMYSIPPGLARLRREILGH